MFHVFKFVTPIGWSFQTNCSCGQGLWDGVGRSSPSLPEGAPSLSHTRGMLTRLFFNIFEKSLMLFQDSTKAVFKNIPCETSQVQSIVRNIGEFYPTLPNIFLLHL